MERLRREELIRPLQCFAASTVPPLPTAVLRLHALLLPMRPSVCVSGSRQSIQSRSLPQLGSFFRAASVQMHTCMHDAHMPYVCILPLKSASARCCNAVVLSHGFVASSVKQCDAHMPPTRSSEPSCETLKQPPGHLETHPRASSPRHPRLRKTALVASLLNLTWIFMITLNR